MNVRSHSVKKILIAAALVASLALVACDNDDDPTAAPATEAPAATEAAATEAAATDAPVVTEAPAEVTEAPAEEIVAPDESPAA
jgi:hypothetical protein